MIDVLIIGGGASALACAIEFKNINKKIKVTIVERLDKIGKKILATGNGRCNLTNTMISSNNYHSDNIEFIESINYNESIKTVEKFFEGMNLLLRKENSLVYPYSNQASSVHEVLKEQISMNNIDVVYNFECQYIKKEKDYYIVSDGNKKLQAQKVVVATGGKSASALGSNGSGYKLLSNLNHNITKLTPGLVQIKLKEKIIRDLKGQRAFSRVTLYKDKEKIKTLDGEVLFTDYGLSGICIMDLSSLIKDKGYSIGIDLMREYSLEEVIEILDNKCKKYPDLKISELLNGIINSKIGYRLIANIFNNLEKKLSLLNLKDKIVVAKNLKEWLFTVDEKLSFDNSQVTCGGINTKEINYNTFESKLNKNLYIIGELLDIDGACGGYNLHFAWYSGIMAARAITKE